MGQAVPGAAGAAQRVSARLHLRWQGSLVSLPLCVGQPAVPALAAPRSYPLFAPHPVPPPCRSVITPHSAFLTAEALASIAATTVDNLRACALGLPLVNEVKP